MTLPEARKYRDENKFVIGEFYKGSKILDVLVVPLHKQTEFYTAFRQQIHFNPTPSHEIILTALPDTDYIVRILLEVDKSFINLTTDSLSDYLKSKSDTSK